MKKVNKERDALKFALFSLEAQKVDLEIAIEEAWHWKNKKYIKGLLENCQEAIKILEKLISGK